MERVFPARAEALAEVRAFVSDIAERVGAGEEERRDFILAVSEACANAITHATGATVRVVTAIVSDRLTVSVRDEGLFLWGAGAEGGYGISMMSKLADELAIDEGSPEHPGTVVWLMKRVSSWRDRVLAREAMVGRNRERIERVERFCRALRRSYQPLPARTERAGAVSTPTE